MINFESYAHFKFEIENRDQMIRHLASDATLGNVPENFCETHSLSKSTDMMILRKHNQLFDDIVNCA